MEVPYATFPKGPGALESCNSTFTRYGVSNGALAPNGILFDLCNNFYGVNSTTFSRKPKGCVLDNISTLSNGLATLHFLRRDRSPSPPIPGGLSSKYAVRIPYRSCPGLRGLQPGPQRRALFRFVAEDIKFHIRANGP